MGIEVRREMGMPMDTEVKGDGGVERDGDWESDGEVNGGRGGDGEENGDGEEMRREMMNALVILCVMYCFAFYVPHKMWVE
jgi:hypothetical protein